MTVNGFIVGNFIRSYFYYSVYFIKSEKFSLPTLFENFVTFTFILEKLSSNQSL